MTTSRSDVRAQILTSLDARDVKALSRMDRSAIGDALLVEIMESAERDHPVIDEDRLASDARLIRFAGHGDLDREVVAWLLARPSTARLDIASVVLQWLWDQHEVFGQRAVDEALVHALLDARTRVELTPEADASSLFALVQALDAPLPAGVRELALDVLAEAAARPHRNPAVVPILLRTLQKAGRPG
jgi:hypothetical protein